MTDEIDLLKKIVSQEEVERVSPKLEACRPRCIGGNRDPKYKIIGARGGRAAGAKSHSFTSLIVQIANYNCIKVACFREIQNSIDDSVYQLIKDKVEFLGYSGWVFKDNKIVSPIGSVFIFKGLKDMVASRNVKGLENIDIFFVEEASPISMASWDILLPTILRNNNSELWFCYNQESEFDPISLKIWNRKREDALLIELKPGKEDNPWWNDRLQKEMESDFDFDPDLAEHIWMGQPRKQGQKAVHSRVKLRLAIDRCKRMNNDGNLQIGVDVARFGDDKTEIYAIRGLKVVDHRELIHANTQEVARVAWDMAGRESYVPIKVDDTGVGGGVTDKLADLGANVIPINFGGSPRDKKKYTTIADEMWFEFPIDEAGIPDDNFLIQELSSRMYDYDSQDRRVIEKKKAFKDRVGRSPDKADALLLAFYNRKNQELSENISSALAKRNR